MTPDAPLAHLCETRRDQLLAVLRETRSCLKNPPLTAAAYLETLRNQGLKRILLTTPFLEWPKELQEKRRL